MPDPVPPRPRRRVRRAAVAPAPIAQPPEPAAAVPNPFDWNTAGNWAPFDQAEATAAAWRQIREQMRLGQPARVPVQPDPVEVQVVAAETRHEEERRLRIELQTTMVNELDDEDLYSYIPGDWGIFVDGDRITLEQFGNILRDKRSEIDRLIRDRQRLMMLLEDRTLTAQMRAEATTQAEAFRERINERQISLATYKARYRGLFIQSFKEALTQGLVPEMILPRRYRINQGPRAGNNGPARFGQAVAPPPNQDYPKTTLRGSATPRFFINYDTFEEWRLRVRGTFISYKDSPIYVSDIVPALEGQRAEELIVTDCNNHQFRLKISDVLEHLNARSFQPGYMDITSLGFGRPCVGYLYRTPARVYRQGLCPDNARILSPYGTEYNTSNFSTQDFFKALVDRVKKTPLTVKMVDTVLNSPTRDANIVSTPLSTNFALVGRRDSDQGEIHHRGIEIAKISRSGSFSCDLKRKIPESLHEELIELNLAA